MDVLEHEALLLLIKQYGLLNELEGEWVFEAVEPGGHVDVVTPFLRGTGQARLRQSGLGEALCEQLECFVAQRLEAQHPQARGGILRFAPYAVELEWLPDFAAGEAARVRIAPVYALSLLRTALRAGMAYPVAAQPAPLTTEQPPTTGALAALNALGERLGFETVHEHGLNHVCAYWRRLTALGGCVDTPLALLVIDQLSELKMALQALALGTYPCMAIVLHAEKSEDIEALLASLLSAWRVSVPERLALPSSVLFCVCQPSTKALAMRTWSPKEGRSLAVVRPLFSSREQRHADTYP